MAVYAALAVFELLVIQDTKLRLVALAILAMFAVKTMLHRRDTMNPERSAENAPRE
ncbi:MAG TPA: hypothetical protein VFA60_07430 [Terriglobales bacterium]|nr:hypothetical protein [Terriglobales bacterium]